jgi:hypothetical protein
MAPQIFFGLSPCFVLAMAAEESHMQELLRSYYDMGEDTAAEDESFDIDAGGFAPERYVESLLQTKSMEELLRCDDKMVKEVKSLDSDMRELVYENYNKFIAATDTIRKMRGDVASMEEEMERLTATMDQVGASSGALNASLASKRDDVDKLVGVRRLLQKLEFLFELPAKLSAAIEGGRYGAAVADFTQVSGILKRYSHVSSFEAIRVESSVAIDGLCVTLMAAVRAALSASALQAAETGGGWPGAGCGTGVVGHGELAAAQGGGGGGGGGEGGGQTPPWLLWARCRPRR